MSDRFKNIWCDPVWSKVIAGIILAVLAALFSLFKGWISDTETIPDAFTEVFTYKVNIWIAIAAFFLFLIVLGIIRKKREACKKPPIPPFVNEFTRWRYQNQFWKWRWEWSPTYKFYYVTDLFIECPNCHEGVLDLEFMNYRCPKCNASYEFAWINGNPEGVKKQIIEDARTRYGFCKEYIGEIKTGYVKQ